jgi:hypothetical protein
MKHLLSRLLVVVFLFSLSSCGMNVLRGEGEIITEMPSVSEFDAVDVTISSDINISVVEGGGNGLELKGYANIIKHIKTEVKDKVLYIEYDLDDTWTVNEEDMKVRISVPSLKSLSLSGAPDAHIQGNIKGEEFRLDISGASEVIIDNINVNKFEVDMSGASELDVKGGIVKHAAYDINGAGKVEAYPLQTEETTASISGVGEGEVTASSKLDATISGAGSVKYKGQPKVTERISGAGSVSPAK